MILIKCIWIKCMQEGWEFCFKLIICVSVVKQNKMIIILMYVIILYKCAYDEEWKTGSINIVSSSPIVCIFLLLLYCVLKMTSVNYYKSKNIP